MGTHDVGVQTDDKIWSHAEVQTGDFESQMVKKESRIKELEHENMILKKLCTELLLELVV